jgi:hypothetical protein
MSKRPKKYIATTVGASHNDDTLGVLVIVGAGVLTPNCSATCLSLGLNTPYPNNDTDDTNKLLEDVEVSIIYIFLRGDNLML